MQRSQNLPTHQPCLGLQTLTCQFQIVGLEEGSMKLIYKMHVQLYAPLYPKSSPVYDNPLYQTKPLISKLPHLPLSLSNPSLINIKPLKTHRTPSLLTKNVLHPSTMIIMILLCLGFV